MGSGENPLMFGVDLEQRADPGIFLFHFLYHIYTDFSKE